MAHGLLYVDEAERSVEANLKLDGIALIREALDQTIFKASVGHRFSNPRHLIAFEDGFHEVVVRIRSGLHGSWR